MNKIILFMSLAIVLSACGKKDSSQALQQEVKVNDPLTVFNIDSFVGNYDLINTERGDCAASMQIIKLCEGVQARNNHLASQAFCNINKGELSTADNRSSTTVTLEANVIKSIQSIYDERSTPPGNVKQVITNTLTIEGDGNLRSLSDSKQNNCLYLKR